MRNNEDRKGGLLSGKPHSEGGIKGVIKDDQRPVELEGGEAIVNKTTMKSDKTFEFEGDEKTPCEIISDLNQLDGKGVPISCDTVEPASRDAYKKGGSVGTQTETYKKWRSLVNMTYSQIKNFYNSQEGKEAGLSSAEAREQGIDSGRESARWLMKMKQTKQSDWTPMMWRWAKKQISFISRMSGNKGGLYDDKGNKTRKHTSLLIWGHNPDKKQSDKFEEGGDVRVLLAPNGKPSNLSPEQYELVRTPAFKKWFGDWENDPENASKVVDANGEPLVVYHGSDKMDTINIFKSSKGHEFNFFSADSLESARYVKDFEAEYPNDRYNQNLRKEYYDKKIKEFFLKSNKIYNYEKISSVEREKSINLMLQNKQYFLDLIKENIKNMGLEYRFYLEDELGLAPNITLEELFSYWLESSSDDWWVLESSIFQNFIKSNNYDSFVTKESGNFNIAVFEPTQIKLADGTNTTFDGSNPDIRFEQGGNISKTPAPLKEQITGSDINKKGSASDSNSAKYIDFSEKTMQAIENKVAEHNKAHNNKKVTISAAKAVVRRGMGAYSTSHRPTISGGKPNSRVAWGLARLNAFLYKIVNGKSESGKYSQDDDLIAELGYTVKKYESGGLIDKDLINLTAFNRRAKSKLKEWDYEHLTTIGEKQRAIQAMYAWEYYAKKNIIILAEPDMEFEGSYYQWVAINDNSYQIFFGFRFGYHGKDKLSISNVNIELLDEDFKEIKDPNILFEQGGSVSSEATLLAPNGKPSNLTPEQYELVRTPAFKQWFGDWENDPKNASKVVDENGEPLVVYHGTSGDLFYVFDLTHFGKTDKGFFGKGFYFTQNKETAESYAAISEWDKINSSFNEKGRVLSCFIKLLTPIIVETKMDFINASGKREIREGYDGKIIIINTLYSPNTEFIAFDSTQIKLADGSNITFDGSNPDIRFAEGGSIDTPYEINAQGGYTYTGEAKSTAKEVDLISIPRSINGTNCGNCYFSEKGVCAHKNIKLPITDKMCCSLWDNTNSMRSWDKPIFKKVDVSDVDKNEFEKNELGGYEYTGEAKEIAKKYDLLTLPASVRGTNCANCSFYTSLAKGGFCFRHNILLPVTPRMSCTYWNNLSADRSWDFFEQGGSVSSESQSFDKVISSSSRFKPSETIYFNPPLIGKNGAKLVSYTWSYEWTMLPNWEGELVGKRISDWTQAEISADTGRDIVHKFGVEMPDGSFKSVSSESVLVLLGYVDRKELKSFPNLVTAAKTLAKQQMKLSILEAQEKEYNELRKRFENAKKPEIVKDDNPEFKLRPLRESWEKGEFNIFRMGDVSVRQYNSYNYSSGTYNRNTPLSRTDKESLERDWVRARISENGGKYPQGIYDLRNRVERQKRKVNEILKSQAQEFEQGGAVDIFNKTEIKKAYVSIRIKNEIKKVGDFNDYQIDSVDENVFEQLEAHQLLGIKGISTSKYNIADWLVHRQCLVMMPFDEFLKINDAEQIRYYDADYLTRDGLDVMFRIYDRKEKTDSAYRSVLQNLFPKISSEFDLEAKISNDSKNSFYAFFSKIFNIYDSGNFIDYFAKKPRVSSVQEFAEIAKEYIESGNAEDDYKYYTAPTNLDTKDIIEIIRNGIVNAIGVYADESEWIIKNDVLNIPNGSRLIFVLGGYSNTKDVYTKYIEKYNLDATFKISFVSIKDVKAFQGKKFANQSSGFLQALSEKKRNVDAKIVSALDEILNDILSNIQKTFTEEFERSFNSPYFDYENTEIKYGKNPFDIPKLNALFIVLRNKLFDFYNAEIENVVTSKSRYTFENIIYRFQESVRELRRESDLQGEVILAVDKDGYEITAYDFYQKMSLVVNDLDVSLYSKSIKERVGSDLYRAYSKDEINFKLGGAIKKITPSPKFYEKGGEITPKQAAEELLKNISPQDLESLKQAYIEARNEALLQSQKRIEYLESSAVKLKELIGTFYPDERQRAIRDVTQKALRHERNVELAYTNGGSIATLDDKIGNTYKSVPDFSNIDTTIITFDEETILEDPKPPYIPFIDEPLFARKGYVVDAIRVMPDLYVYATNGFNGDAKSLLIRANSPVAFATLEDIGGYILVTLDQLVLITDYYITIAKAKSRLEAAAQTERNEKYYDSQSEGYRERILNQRGFYRTLPLSIQKKITQEDWEALDLQGKEAIYKPYKRQGSKRAVSKFKPNSMYTSFHLMYEVFLNPEAKLRGRTGHPEVFAYWRKFAEMMSYKLVDISEARKFESESYQAGLETSFGDSNTDPELYNTYGLLVKRQNGDKIAPFEIDQIKDAWIKLNSTFGKLTRQAKEFGLKISHAGLKHMYARKSIGVYWSRFKTIGVSNIYGAKPFTYIFAHEVGHWIDNLLGSQTGKRYLCDDYESEAGQIAVAFRKNMNKKSTSDYYNSTKECFARAMEQHFALSTDGDNASMVTPIEDKVKEMLYVLNDNYVSADSYHNTIKPLILAFFVKYKDFFVYDTDIVEDMPAVIEPNAQIETTKEAVAEAKKEVSDLPKQQVTSNHGYGQVINNLYSDWSRIKNQKEQSNWEETVRNIKFGTYGTKGIFDVLENFPLTGLSEVTRLSFLSDLEGALKIPFDERKYNTKVDIDLGLIQRQKELALAMELELALIEIELELE